MFVNDRREIIKAVLATDDSDTIDSAMKSWWQNIRSSGGLRLTENGDEQFRLANLQCYDYEYAFENYTSSIRLALYLDSKMITPYFLHYKNSKSSYIRIYDGRIAVLVELYGSIYNYIDTLLSRTD
jgi:hypothetical protein